MLVTSFDIKNHKMRREAIWKQEALNLYPKKPSYQDKKRNYDKAARKNRNKDIMGYR